MRQGRGRCHVILDILLDCKRSQGFNSSFLQQLCLQVFQGPLLHARRCHEPQHLLKRQLRLSLRFLHRQMAKSPGAPPSNLHVCAPATWNCNCHPGPTGWNQSMVACMTPWVAATSSSRRLALRVSSQSFRSASLSGAGTVQVQTSKASSLSLTSFCALRGMPAGNSLRRVQVASKGRVERRGTATARESEKLRISESQKLRI